MSGHFLFSFAVHVGKELTVRPVLELARVAKEVRIFPLKSNEQERGAPFVWMEDVVEALDDSSLFWRVKEANYHFQEGANEVFLIYSEDER